MSVPPPDDLVENEETTREPSECAPDRSADAKSATGATTTDSDRATSVATTNKPQNMADVEASEEDLPPFQSLDRRWIRLLRYVELMSWGILGLVALIGGVAILRVATLPFQVLIAAIWALLLVVSLFRIVWWPRLNYDHWSFRVGDKVFELRRGIVWNVAASVPLSRLQHVDLHRGPLERRFDLASLQIHTAGTHDATQTIPGLDEKSAIALRDQLIDAANRGLNEPASS